MELTFHGANYLSLKTKQARLAVDPKIEGKKLDLRKYDIVIFTQSAENLPSEDNGNQLVIDIPGEYEAREISFIGMPANLHIDDKDARRGIVYRLNIGDVKIGIIGHIAPALDNGMLEMLGGVDILTIPVGGFGYTLDAIAAADVVRQLEPKIVVPTHYAATGVKYEVKQAPLQPFIDEMGAPVKQIDRLKIKSSDFPEELLINVLDIIS